MCQRLCYKESYRAGQKAYEGGKQAYEAWKVHEGGLEDVRVRIRPGLSHTPVASQHSFSYGHICTDSCPL